MAYGGYAALQRYKMKGLYRKVRRLGRTARAGRKLRAILSAGPSGVPDSLRMKSYGANWASALPEQKLMRQATGFYGDGDYKSFLRKFIPDGTFASAGRTLGGMSGIPGLNAAGAFAGNKLSSWLGFGDYTNSGDAPSGNQIMGGEGSQQQISVNPTDASGDVIVSRTEFISNVIASGTAGTATPFQVTSYAINPGLAQSFPWLSQVAQNFTLYEFHGLIFQYKPLFSENSGSANNLGKVIMATEYDPGARNFLTSVEMENYDYSNSSKPSCGMYHGVETKNSQQPLNQQYIRTGVSTRDLIFTDIGKFEIASEGIPLPAAATSVVIGELWVTYNVKLSRAELYNSLLGNAISTDILKGNSSAGALNSGTPTFKSSNSIGVSVTNVSATAFQVTFPVNITLGYYLVFLEFVSGGTTFSNQVVTTPGTAVNCQLYTQGETLPGGASGAQINPNGLTATVNNAISGIWNVYVNSPGLSQASFVANVSAALTATTTWKLWVIQANGSVAQSIS